MLSLLYGDCVKLVSFHVMTMQARSARKKKVASRKTVPKFGLGHAFSSPGPAYAVALFPLRS